MRPVVHEHFPGTSLDHILGFKNCVGTTYHSLTGCVEEFGGPLRRLSFWAMRARNYDDLDLESTDDLKSLQDAGAIEVKRYYASAKDKNWDVSTYSGHELTAAFIDE